MTRIYVGTQPDPNQRRTIKVSDADGALVMAARGHKGTQMVVTDLDTGNDQYIKTASCGLDECYCALEFA